MMKKSEASRTFLLAGGLVKKKAGGGVPKQGKQEKKVRIEKRGAVLRLRSSENPPQLNKIPKIKKRMLLSVATAYAT